MCKLATQTCWQKKIMENAFKEWGYQISMAIFIPRNRIFFPCGNGEGKWYLIVGHAFILNVYNQSQYFSEFLERSGNLKKILSILSHWIYCQITLSLAPVLLKKNHFPRLIIKDFSCHILQFYLQLIYFIGWQWCVFHCCLFSIIPSHT